MQMTGMLWKRAVGAVVGLCLALGATAQQATEAEKSNEIIVDGSTTVGPVAKAFAEYFKSKNITVPVSESGSGNGFKALLNGTCKVAALSRFLKDSEFKAAVEKGIVPVPHVVALDGLAVVVHPSNPVENLSLEQIKAIYTGKVSNWKEVGGSDQPIVRISRDTNSGTYECFESLVLHGAEIVKETEYVGSNQAAKTRVQSTPSAIGYISLGHTGEGVKTLAVDGVKPSKRTVVEGVYPVARPLFFFTNGYPKLGTPLHQFVTLSLTPEGQEIIESKGFVPVTHY